MNKQQKEQPKKLIELKHLSMIFGQPKNVAKTKELLESGMSLSDVRKQVKTTIAIHDINLDINEGELFVIVGLSGSGKSTLIRCLNLLNKPTMGQVVIQGNDITAYDNETLRTFRRNKISMVFQHFGLLSHRSVLNNVAFGLEVQGVDEGERNARSMEAIESVGLKGWHDKKPHQLSGGMKQRVGLARALVTNPDILLMDEPYSALDPLIRRDMQNELLSLEDNMNRTIVFITHDMNEAFKMGDRIALMKDGQVVQLGTPQSFFKNPANDYVVNFIQDVDKTQILRARSVYNHFEETLKLGTSISDAKAFMESKDLSFSYVTNDDQTYAGYIEYEDIVDLSRGNIDKLLKFVDPVARNMYLKDILSSFKEDFKSLPVVDNKGHFKGDITKSDIIESIA